MVLLPEKMFVFSSVSDDSIGFQIYRLLYEHRCHDLIFMEGEYNSTKEIKDYILPGEDGEDEKVSVDTLLEIFEEVEDTTVIEYDSLGMFYDFNLGFDFTDEMIDEVVSEIHPESVATKLKENLSQLSYISQNWAVLEWEESLDMIIENLDFVVNSESDFGAIDATILESAKFKTATYPQLFEILLYVADLYDEEQVFIRTRTKVFCIKTNINAQYQHFIYDRDEIEIPEGDNIRIFDANPALILEWMEHFFIEDVEDELVEEDLS